MIQRIQSIYLLVATLLSGGFVFLAPLWKNEDAINFFVLDAFSTDRIILKAIPVLFFLSAILTFVAIFKFKNRKLQFVLGRFSIMVNFILLGIIVVITQNLSGGISISEKGIGLLIPIASIVLVSLANRAIKRDEELVKSADRLR
ncbi:DUF4293 domain-containing protein [Lutibacter sp. TH_r2]|uniref:DUF4293 domain-containing protein n=1 Tax=Lutibacter sp. TH_r2 TaxID=3082083 RepID=UPI0029539AD6|nr:DUF4293 domain-containing protein [Lutibacter sp. TH_r2]MDV7185849.1 DUF4293 domain-containing protein [Lutibacter sp. TH_r2]